MINFIGWRILLSRIVLTESELLPMANDNEPNQPDPEQPAKPEPVSDSE